MTAATYTPEVRALARQLAGRLISTPTYQDEHLSTQLGPAVAAYLSWKRNEDGARASTLDGYERVLARLCFTIQKPVDQIDTGHLRAVIAAFTEGQRHKATSVFKDFFKWHYQEGLIDLDPAARLRHPRRAKAAITDLYTDEEKFAIVTAQTDVMDRVGVLLLLRAGLRQAELRGLQVRDVNLIEKYVLVRRGKGGKARRVPVKGELVRALEELMLTNLPGHTRPRMTDEYLLCPTRGGRSQTRAPEKPMGKRGAHEWWYRCLKRAGLVDEGVTHGRRMHAARHTYATDLGKATNWNFVAVQKNLGHANIGVTVDTYMQFAFEDQAEAVASLPEISSE